MRSSSTSELAALLEEQVLTEAVAADHLQREPAEIADALLAHAAQRTPFAPELARRGGASAGPPGAGGTGRSCAPAKSERPAMAAASASALGRRNVRAG